MRVIHVKTCLPVFKYTSSMLLKMSIIDKIYECHALHSGGFISDVTHNVLYTVLKDLKDELK